MSLKIENLTGGYSQTPVIKDISFDINNGELVGLIGLNGAGKSTTIKHIIGLMDPFSGQMTLDGQALKENPSLYRKKIGFIPETPLLYDELTLKEHIEITAMAYDVDVSIAMERATPLLKKFRLQDRLEWFPSDFSKGMKQKVMILCAFITEPSLYIIDEPFLGLDPIAIRDLIQMMEQKKKEGASLLMSTHVLTNAEKICDKFIIINRGEIYAKGTLKELRETFSMPNASLDDIYTRLADKEGFLK